jgi:AcrR family transcriptional regulator
MPMSDIEQRIANRRLHIIGAAQEVFLRYGLARTTMGDIAQNAGVSRPTLYAAFGDKGVIYQAVLDNMVDELLLAIREGLKDRQTLEQKLFFACTTWATDGFERIRAYPDSRDLIDIGRPAIAAAYRAFGDLLAEILTDAEAGPAPYVSDTSVMMYAALHGFQEAAKDRDELWRMIARLSAAVGKGA